MQYHCSNSQTVYPFLNRQWNPHLLRRRRSLHPLWHFSRQHRFWTGTPQPFPSPCRDFLRRGRDQHFPSPLRSPPHISHGLRSCVRRGRPFPKALDRPCRMPRLRPPRTCIVRHSAIFCHTVFVPNTSCPAYYRKLLCTRILQSFGVSSEMCHCSQILQSVGVCSEIFRSCSPPHPPHFHHRIPTSQTTSTIFPGDSSRISSSSCPCAQRRGCHMHPWHPTKGKTFAPPRRSSRHTIRSRGPTSPAPSWGRWRSSPRSSDPRRDAPGSADNPPSRTQRCPSRCQARPRRRTLSSRIAWDRTGSRYPPFLSSTVSCPRTIPRRSSRCGFGSVWATTPRSPWFPGGRRALSGGDRFFVWRRHHCDFLCRLSFSWAGPAYSS